MKRPSGHSEHTVANALEAASQKRFREPTQHVFSDSPIILRQHGVIATVAELNGRNTFAPDRLS